MISVQRKTDLKTESKKRTQERVANHWVMREWDLRGPYPDDGESECNKRREYHFKNKKCNFLVISNGSTRENFQYL